MRVRYTAADLEEINKLLRIEPKAYSLLGDLFTFK